MHVWIAGASGLTGSFLLSELLQHPLVDQVTSLVRRSSGLSHPRLREILFKADGSVPDNLQKPDAVFCCLGTTINKAGSKEAFRKVDVLLVEDLIHQAKAKGVRSFVLQSSVGANAQSGNFYLRCKGEAEQALVNSGIVQVAIVRPSFLAGNRKEFRLGERFGLAMMRLLNPLFIGKLRRYRSVKASTVARVMLNAGIDQREGVWIIESEFLV